MPSLSQRKRIVAGFLRRCNDYAEQRIADYSARQAGADAMTALTLQDKIGHWCAYRAFNEHALAELDGSELDDWLGDG